jgi:NAD(P)-dependent dehydrogenase (short-subunit alcohol dehydrogenase family)
MTGPDARKRSGLAAARAARDVRAAKLTKGKGTTTDGVAAKTARTTATVALAGTAALIAWRTLQRRRRLIDLTDQVVLVTGGSRGLGLLLAREFARQGARVAICSRDEVQLENARADLESRGAVVFAHPCDVRDQAQVEELVSQVTEHLGPIDILVNNAGNIQVGPLDALTMEDFEDALATIFWGPLHTSLAVLPGMRARRHGRIVNISSIGGRVSVPHLLPYSAAKFALRGLSEGLHAEVVRDDVVVSTILPGLMRTGSPVNALFRGQQAKEFTWFSIGDATPLTAMGAERAARRIVLAARRGEVEVTLSWQAKLLGLAHDLLPSVTIELLGAVNRLLPDAGPDTEPDAEPGTEGAGQAGGESQLKRGMHLSTRWSPSPLTTLMNRAARDYNQFGGSEEPTPGHARRAGL